MKGGSISEAVLRLRREFDERFEHSRDASYESPAAYLLVQIGDALHAVSATAVRGIEPCPAITQVPTSVPALRGLAAVRGVVLGIYDLCELLGASQSGRDGSGWILVCRDGETGLLVDAIAGWIRARTDSLRSDPSARTGASIAAVLELDGEQYPVIDVGAVMKRLGADSPSPTERE